MIAARTITLAAAMLAMPAVSHAQIPAVGFGGLARVQTINEGPIPNLRNDCCGLFSAVIAPINIPPIISGQYNWIGQPLSYTILMTNESRSFGVQLIAVEDQWGNMNQFAVALFAGNWQGAFNAWAPRADDVNNYINYWCCVPITGQRYTIQVTYNTYAYQYNQVSMNGSPLQFIGVYSEGDAFQPDIAGHPFYIGMDSLESWGWGVFPGDTGYIGVMSGILWMSWDTGQAVQVNLSNTGDTSSFYTNYGAGGNLYNNQLFEGQGLWGGFPPYDSNLP